MRDPVSKNKVKIPEDRYTKLSSDGHTRAMYACKHTHKNIHTYIHNKKKWYSCYRKQYGGALESLRDPAILGIHPKN